MTDMRDYDDDMHLDPAGAEGGVSPSDLAAADPTAADLAEILRLDEALTRVERQRVSGLDRREDPELSSMVDAASAFRSTFEHATETQSFQSFHQRSRAAVLHALEAERPVPVRERVRVVVAAAAGLAAVFISVATLGGPLLDGDDGRGGAQVSTTNLTSRSSEAQLQAVSESVRLIQDQAENGRTVSGSTLHAFTERVAAMADAIEREPQNVSPETVMAFAQQAEDVQDALSSVKPEPGAEDAAVAAQRAAEDGQVVASRYLGGGLIPGEVTPEPETPTPTAAPTETGTPDPTETPTATPSETPPASSTPAPTETAISTSDIPATNVP